MCVRIWLAEKPLSYSLVEALGVLFEQKTTTASEHAKKPVEVHPKTLSFAEFKDLVKKTLVRLGRMTR